MTIESAQEDRKLKIVHLTASGFFGGPERQMLELAKQLPDRFQTTFLSYGETFSREFFQNVGKAGFERQVLHCDFPHLLAARRELVRALQRMEATIVCCHGYKANLLGLSAAKCLAIPKVAVSRGWTGESHRVRLYEKIDRFVIRGMDRVICVSHAQAERVKRAGVKAKKIVTIRNAIRVERFNQESANEPSLRELFPRPPRTLVASAGRLSPEKGFDTFIDAAATVAQSDKEIGFALFGEGKHRPLLEEQIRQRKLQDRFLLLGHCRTLDAYYPQFDAFVLPSHTEGLSNVLLESLAASIPVVATDVGGNPELVRDGTNGYLVPVHNSQRLAQRILDLLNNPDRQSMGRNGCEFVMRNFTFAVQSTLYADLFEGLAAGLRQEESTSWDSITAQPYHEGSEVTR